MTQTNQDISKDVVKQITLRWPKRLWLLVTLKSSQLETSIQSYTTQAVLERLGKEYWTTVNEKDKKDREVEEILKFYNYVPEDLKQAVEKAIRDKPI